MELVRRLAGDLVEDVRMFDEFTHPKTGRKSNAYRIVYRSLERTLTTEEVLALHDKVRKALTPHTQARVEDSDGTATNQRPTK